MSEQATNDQSKPETSTNPNAKYVMNNDNTNNNDNNNTMDVDEKKDDGKDIKNASSSSLGRKTSASGSSYYLYKSTDPEEAKKFAPKKLDTEEAAKLEARAKSQAKGSTWNTGATMETFEYTPWMKERVSTLLKAIHFQNTGIRITEISEFKGDANILMVRGKPRPGFHIDEIKFKWQGYLDPNQQEPDITDEDDEDDKDNDKDKEDAQKTKKKKKKKKSKSKKPKGSVTITGIDTKCGDLDPDDWDWSFTGNSAEKKIIKKHRDNFIAVFETFDKELKAKKK